MTPNSRQQVVPPRATQCRLRAPVSPLDQQPCRTASLSVRTPLLSRSLAAVCSSLTPLLPADPRIGSLGFLPKKRSQRLRGKGACLAATARVDQGSQPSLPRPTPRSASCSAPARLQSTASRPLRAAVRLGPAPCARTARVSLPPALGLSTRPAAARRPPAFRPPQLLTHALRPPCSAQVPQGRRQQAAALDRLHGLQGWHDAHHPRH